MAIKIPQLDRKTLMIVGGVIVLAAAGWFAWDMFLSEPPPPPPAPVAIAPPKPAPKPAPPPVVEAKPVVEEPKEAEAVAAEPEPKRMSTPRRHSRANEDARACLDEPTSLKIRICAERYR